MRLRSILWLILLCLSVQTFAQSFGGTQLPLTKGAKASVLFFLSPECPMCLQYPATLKELKDKWSSDSVSFVAVFPGNWDALEVRRHMYRYGLEYEMVLDSDLGMARSVGAKITPEVFILDSLGDVYYHGAIDDWYYTLGRRRASPTVNYVDACLVKLLRGLPPPYAPTKALGCYIFP